MEFIEEGILSGSQLEEYLKDKLCIYKKEEIASIVLGCTHYPFVKETIEKDGINNYTININGNESDSDLIRKLIDEIERIQKNR